MRETTSALDDPFHALRRLEKRASHVGASCIVLALAIHGGLFQGAVWSALLGLGVFNAHAQTGPQTVELEVEPPPPPPVVPEVLPDPPEEKPTPTAPKYAAELIPAAARAGAALVAEPEEEPKPDDENALVTADNETYAGGETDHDGTGDVATVGGHGAGAAPNVVPGPPAPPPPPPPPPPPDLSRTAKCPTDVDWECEPPSYAKEDRVVILQLAVLENGRVGNVMVLASPGGDYDAEARKCSARQKCIAALDRNGVAIRGETKPIRVRFTH